MLHNFFKTGSIFSVVSAEQFAKGGSVESLEKELHKLRRELNSKRLSTYLEGDNSEEEVARKKEREVKLSRFNEVLGLLNKDGKYENGGGVELGKHVDLFENYEKIPQRVKGILEKYWGEFGDSMDYSDTKNMLDEVEAEGYTFDYYLDNEPYGLRPIDVKLNELEGYEEFEKGGELDEEVIEEEFDDMIPDSEDCFVSDVVRGGYDVSCGGKFIGHFSEYDDAVECAFDWREENNFYPTVWFVNERGSTHPIDENGDAIKYVKGGGIDLVRLRDTVYEVVKSGNGNPEWKIIAKYDSFDEYIKAKKARSSYIDTDDWRIHKVLFNLNGFERNNVLSFVPDLKVSDIYDKYAKGGGVSDTGENEGDWLEDKFVDGGKIETIKTRIHDLYSKRSEWIGSFEAKANQKSPYDAEINKLHDELKKEIENETETYNFFSLSDYSGKSTEEKVAKMFYSFYEKNPFASLSKFIKSLKTPAQKEAFRKLQFPTYQKKWGIKMIANKTKDSIKFKKIFSDGGGVAEGWTDDELSDSEAQYAGGGKLKQKGTSDKAHDKVYKAKRVGYRYRDDFAKKHGLSPNTKPTEEHIEKYLHKGVYFEDRADRSDKSRMKKLEDGGRVYKLGDKYSNDFDYEGMLEFGSTATIELGEEKLEKLHRSFEDVNYHTAGRPLWAAVKLLRAGNEDEAKQKMVEFNIICKEELIEANTPDTLEHGGGIDRDVIGKVKAKDTVSLIHEGAKVGSRTVRVTFHSAYNEKEHGFLSERLKELLKKEKVENFDIVEEDLRFALKDNSDIKKVEWVKDGNYSKGGEVDSRIAKMIEGWNEEGRAFSHLGENDNEFFEKIGVPYMKIGITSQTGNDLVYYDTNLYNSDDSALKQKVDAIENVAQKLKSGEMFSKHRMELAGMYSSRKDAYSHASNLRRQGVPALFVDNHPNYYVFVRRKKLEDKAGFKKLEYAKGGALSGEWVLYNPKTDKVISIHKSHRSANMAMNKAWAKGEHETLSIQVKSEFDKAHNFASGGSLAQKNKVARVMHEFKSGKLKSSSGDLVTDRAQAIAIALSSAGIAKKEDGGFVTTIESFRLPASDVTPIGKGGIPNYNTPLDVNVLNEEMIYAKGGGVESKRKMYLHDAVLYKGELHYISLKNGVLGLENLKRGAWGSDYPFTPIGKINIDDVTDMMGRKVSIEEMRKGGSISEDLLMAKSDVLKLEEYAKKISDSISPSQEVDAWVISKISKVEQTTANVKHTLEAEYPKMFAVGGKIDNADGNTVRMMCLHIGKYAKSLLKAIESGVVLDSWMKHELSIAGSMIDSVFHYLDYFNSGNHLAKGGGVSDESTLTYDEMRKYEKGKYIHFNPMNGRWEFWSNGKAKEFWNQAQAEKFAGFGYNQDEDARYSRKKYEGLYSKGGNLKANDLAIGTKIKHKGTGVTVKVWNVNPTTGLMQCERDGVKFPQWRSAKDYELVKK